MRKLRKQNEVKPIQPTKVTIRLNATMVDCSFETFRDNAVNSVHSKNLLRQFVMLYLLVVQLSAQYAILLNSSQYLAAGISTLVLVSVLSYWYTISAINLFVMTEWFV